MAGDCAAPTIITCLLINLKVKNCTEIPMLPFMFPINQGTSGEDDMATHKIDLLTLFNKPYIVDQICRLTL